MRVVCGVWYRNICYGICRCESEENNFNDDSIKKNNFTEVPTLFRTEDNVFGEDVLP